MLSALGVAWHSVAGKAAILLGAGEALPLASNLRTEAPRRPKECSNSQREEGQSVAAQDETHGAAARKRRAHPLDAVAWSLCPPMARGVAHPLHPRAEYCRTYPPAADVRAAQEEEWNEERDALPQST